MKNSKLNRREFLGRSAMLGAATTVGMGATATSLSSCSNAETKSVSLRPISEIYIPELPDLAIDGAPLRAGLVGCGWRGNGAMLNYLDAAPNVQLVAMGDVLQERVDEARAKLKEERGVEIADDKCFVGFDAYKKVIDSGIDVVILTTPPAFRPEHCRYAVEQGKHAFLEKPIAVDASGYRVLVAAAKQAEAKGLTMITGTQRHHKRDYVAAYEKVVKEGLIGEITGGSVYWNQTQLWYKTRKKEWCDMEYMIRDWVNWTWLSGDHIVEQHVHNIDVFNWFFGGKPISCVGFGSRQRRKTGDQYDNFSCEFVYENGVRLHSLCRQMDGCATNISEFIQGTKGSLDTTNMIIKDLDGKELWRYDYEAEKAQYKQTNEFVLEHVNMINCIRKNTPLQQIEATAISTLCAVMGRESAYTGKECTWDQTSAMTQNLLPNVLAMGASDKINVVIPVPGTDK